MKCPMCGSDEVTAYVYAKLKWDSLPGWYFACGPGEVDDKALADCECGWGGEVNELEQSE